MRGQCAACVGVGVCVPAAAPFTFAVWLHDKGRGLGWGLSLRGVITWSWAGAARGAAAEQAPVLRTGRPCVRNMRSASVSGWHRSTCVSGARAAVPGLHRGRACASGGLSHTRTYLVVAILLLSRRVGSATPGLALVHNQHMPGPHAICLYAARQACATFVLERSVDRLCSLSDVVKGAAFLVV